MRKKVVLFGAGRFGKEAINWYGKENVDYFCDNNKYRIGEIFEGKRIISVDELINMKDKVIVIVCSGQGRNNIVNMLKRFGINKILLFEKCTSYTQLKDKINFKKYNTYKKEIENNEKQKIKIRFYLLSFRQGWNTIKSICEQFLADERYEIMVVVRNKDDIKYKHRNILQVEKENYDISKDKPNVIFYMNGNISGPNEINEMSKYTKLIINIPYVYYLIDKESYTYLDDRVKYLSMESSCFNLNNSVHLGHPALDGIYKKFKSKPDIPIEWQKKIENKKVFLWNAVHGYMETLFKGTTFHDLFNFLMNYFANRDDIALIFRPHPLLFKELISNSISSTEEIEQFRNYCLYSKNIVLDETLEYFTAFQVSDALISDLSGLLFSYLFTNKPVLYLNRKDVELNENMNKLYYLADVDSDNINKTFDNIDKFIKNICNNVDDLRGEREKEKSVFDKYFDGNTGIRIKKYIDDFIEG